MSSGTSELPSPILSPSTTPPESPKSMPSDERRRSSIIIPPDSELITLPKRSRSGSKSPRRGSQVYLIGGDNILLQFEGGKRRLSSFCTSSNDETMINMDDTMTEEEIMETLKAHKQIIANIKTQQWPMHRKLKILRRAKMYIKKHEGDLKQSKQAKDIVLKYRTFLGKTLNRMKRELDNLIVQLTPWEMRIKKIESQFGSVVASYFTFLRWIFWVNTTIAIFLCIFVIVPEILRGDDDPTKLRKYPEAGSNLTFKKVTKAFYFEGYLKYSAIFYGYYGNEEATNLGYRLPLAYFCSMLALYLFSFFCILRKMTKNSRLSRATSKEDEYVFTWKLFTGWDFMIGNSETAYNKVASIVLGFKEVILEEKEKKKDIKDWKLIAHRIIVNLLVLILLVSSAYAVVLVVERSLNMPPNAGFIRQAEQTIVVTGVNFIYPMLFGFLSVFEKYHPRIALRWQLGRILILNLLNFYTLMISTFDKVEEMNKKVEIYRQTIINNTLTTMQTILESDEIRLIIKNSSRSRRSPSEGRLYPPVEDVNTYLDLLPRTTEDMFFTDEQTELEPVDGRHYLKWTTPTLATTKESTETQETIVFTETDKILTTYKIKSFTSPPLLTSNHKYPSTSKIPSPLLAKTTKTTKISKDKSTSRKTLVTSPTTRVVSIHEKTSIHLTTEKPSSTTLTTKVNPTTLCMQESTSFSYSPDNILLLSEEDRENLRNLCWETMFGQEIAKLTSMDLYFTILQCVCFEYARALAVRYCNKCGCIFWDLETQFPGYSDFQIAENILSLVNNQGMIWLGMFFSPGLPVINTVKLCILMYVRSWAVLTTNIPHETVFKATGSNNFYYALLLLFLFICILPVGYAVVWLKPSWHCGPFSGYQKMYHILTFYIKSKLPDKINAVIDYLTSPGTIIPVILLLLLIIFYLMSSVSSLREANSDLKSQLRKEKDEPEETAQQETLSPPQEILTPSMDKKHVRINAEFVTDEKARLLKGP